MNDLYPLDDDRLSEKPIARLGPPGSHERNNENKKRKADTIETGQESSERGSGQAGARCIR